MNRYEAMGLSPEQIEGLSRVAAAYTAAGRPTSVDDLVRFVASPMKTDIEKLEVSFQELSEALKFPWYSPILWTIQDAFDALRGLLWDMWANATLMACPEHYLGGEWEPEECENCPWARACGKEVMSN